MTRYEQYHVFSIPQPLLDTLVPRNIISQPAVPSRPASPTPAPTSNTAAAGSRACNICLGVTFADVEEQRTHFRSDWHRYNVKMRVGGGNAVSEAQFAQLVDKLEDSLSGSASSDSDSDAPEDDAVSTLVHKTKRLKTVPEELSDAEDDVRRNVPNAPVIWFHSPPATQLGVYKALFPHDVSSARGPEQSQMYLDAFKSMQTGGGEEGRKWALFMVAGGHFAGAVVRVSRPEGEEGDSGLTKKGKPKKATPDTEVLKHKTFHRYTTRRKQGGSQSANDNAKSKAVSAGAMLRRYGETALREDIRNLLTDWAEELADCERIFIRASVSNRRIFFDYDDAILQKGDDRFRTFPFPTRRPTQSELLRCLMELTRVKLSHLTEDELRAQDEAYLATLPKPRPVPTPAQPQKKPEKPKLSPEEQARLDAQHDLADKWERALEMVRKGRLDALKGFVAKEANPLGPGGVDARAPDELEDAGRGETLLVYATRKGQEDIVRWLLEDARANPTLNVQRGPGTASLNPEPNEVPPENEDEDESRPLVEGAHRTAYDYARTRALRNVFRRAAAEHPEWWDWLGIGDGGARVPSALSREAEEGREEKKKVRRKGLKDKVKEREAAMREKEQAQPAVAVVAAEPKPKARKDATQGPRKLGGSKDAGEGVAGLTPEMRAKVERERRARAAEARLRTIGGAR